MPKNNIKNAICKTRKSEDNKSQTYEKFQT